MFYLNLITKLLPVLLLFTSLPTLVCQPVKVLDSNTEEKLNLHVPSPDWQDQVIYFLMIDRFNDGDPSNNDQGMNEYDPNDSRKFSGGDLDGVIQKLDYIKALGATAIWITPPVANQWWDPSIQYGGYHGYWAENFKKVDAHFGNLQTYQQLSHQLHERGMYLMQDIVVNHTGNFFEYGAEYDPNDKTIGYSLNKASTPLFKPSQYPFNLNDPTNLADREANIYHWTPPISDYANLLEKLTYQMASLDDINTENIVVRNVLRNSFGYWVRVVGVDGYRIDTIIYVEMDFWADFMNAINEEAPGINIVAAETGRDDFLTFGETFITSDPLDNTGDKEVAKYQGTTEKPALNSMLNYPLYYTINRVFAQGLPTHYMGYRLNAAVNSGIYKDPYIVANFIDNHDWSRFISSTKPVALKQALYLLFTIPGIPVIYQGTEQLFEESRSAMFANGWDSKGKDHFDDTSEMYGFIKNLARIRSEYKLFSRGDLKILQDSEVGAGVLAYSRSYEGQQAIIIFNTADHPVLVGKLATDLQEGLKLKLLAGINLNEDLITQEDGKLNLTLAARSVGIYLVTEEENLIEKQAFDCVMTTELEDSTYNKNLTITGYVNSQEYDYQVVIDGNLSQSINIVPDAENKWQINIPISMFPFGKSDHSLALYSPDQMLVTDGHEFSIRLDIQGEVTTVRDPENDDHGPSGDYIKPTDKSFKAQMDIEEVRVTNFGGNLQIEIITYDLSNVWLPPNGFDHASFHVFIDLPDQTGEKILPQIHATAPADFEWNYLFYVAGWNQAMYHFETATKDHYGKIITPTPTVAVDESKNKITIQFPPGALGYAETLEGARIYITSWDGTGSENGHRAINEKGGAYEFGGTNNPNAPLILDDTAIIEITKK